MTLFLARMSRPGVVAYVQAALILLVALSPAVAIPQQGTDDAGDHPHQRAQTDSRGSFLQTTVQGNPKQYKHVYDLTEKSEGTPSEIPKICNIPPELSASYDEKAGVVLKWESDHSEIAETKSKRVTVLYKVKPTASQQKEESGSSWVDAAVGATASATTGQPPTEDTWHGADPAHFQVKQGTGSSHAITMKFVLNDGAAPQPGRRGGIPLPPLKDDLTYDIEVKVSVQDQVENENESENEAKGLVMFLKARIGAVGIKRGALKLVPVGMECSPLQGSQPASSTTDTHSVWLGAKVCYERPKCNLGKNDANIPLRTFIQYGQNAFDEILRPDSNIEPKEIYLRPKTPTSNTAPAAASSATTQTTSNSATAAAGGHTLQITSTSNSRNTLSATTSSSPKRITYHLADLEPGYPHLVIAEKKEQPKKQGSTENQKTSESAAKSAPAAADQSVESAPANPVVMIHAPLYHQNSAKSTGSSIVPSEWPWVNSKGNAVSFRKLVDELKTGPLQDPKENKPFRDGYSMMHKTILNILGKHGTRFDGESRSLGIAVTSCTHPTGNPTHTTKNAWFGLSGEYPDEITGVIEGRRNERYANLETPHFWPEPPSTLQWGDVKPDKYWLRSPSDLCQPHGDPVLRLPCLVNFCEDKFNPRQPKMVDGGMYLQYSACKLS
eukprot:TRINITY_DN6566_c0_g1_i3.p1 TRINITY_DN6566_c0_g1~~TRINITY_DN6566_c0_g1_i3.p1  ORF type:complete len:668 (+),score=16.76 TRINITY_DN6566_c0_g1_i3:107-2110(+)